jgi:hypothetical protein
VLRTDGAQYFAEAKGVVIQYSPQKDNGAFVDQLSIFTIGEATQTFATLTTPLELDRWYDFRVIDTGDAIYLYWNGSAAPTLSYSTSYRAGNHITFYSREGRGAGSSISNDGRGRLDFISVARHITCAEENAALEAHVAQLTADNEDLTAMVGSLAQSLATANAANVSLNADQTQALLGLAEIQRLLRLAPGQRTSTARFTGASGTQINAVIDALVAPPGQGKARN